jgi:hypothetical protein
MCPNFYAPYRTKPLKKQGKQEVADRTSNKVSSKINKIYSSR